MDELITLSKQLMARQSLTPDDAGCQVLIAEQLSAVGFEIQSLAVNGVSNLYATHGSGAPLLIFSGHTDVVPPGALQEWNTAPFEPTEKNGMLYGRGAADMKTAVAAMVVAAKNMVSHHPNHQGTIAFAITSDEEGPAVDGSRSIVNYLKQQGIKPDYVLVGEASAEQHVADTVKVGRRGSMHGKLTVIGKQGHIAYPQKADNPIHRSFKALDALAQAEWDQADVHFPATSLQFYDVQSGVGASNVIPGTLTATFNFRFSPSSTVEGLQQKIAEILDQYQLRYHIDYDVSSLPFFSGACDFSALCQAAVQSVCGYTPLLSTAGGTSDGRFFAPICSQVIELGVVNASIHKVNECVSVAELQSLLQIYQNILKRVFVSGC